MLKRVLTRVDLPRPDSPAKFISSKKINHRVSVHTNNHNVEVETLANTLAMPLVGQVGESNVSSQLAAHDVLVLSDSRGRGSSEGGWVGRRDSLDRLHDVVGVW